MKLLILLFVFYSIVFAESFIDSNANGVWDDAILGDNPSTPEVVETDFVLVEAEQWTDVGGEILHQGYPDWWWYDEWYIPLETYYEILEGNDILLNATPEYIFSVHPFPIYMNEDFDGDGNLDIAEDLNQNGILDVGEDIDGDGFLDINEDIDGDNILDLNASIFVDQNTNNVLSIANGLSNQNITDFDINDYYIAEPFDDTGNGVYDLGEEFTDVQNGVYDL